MQHAAAVLHVQYKSTWRRPLLALHLQVLSRCVYSARSLDGSARVALDVEVKQLQDSLGNCERILYNPIPLSYTRHTARFLVLWLLLLPLALWEKMLWGVVPTTLIISYLLFGIDQIAVQMVRAHGCVCVCMCACACGYVCCACVVQWVKGCTARAPCPAKNA